ncbi:MAG TPA: hypothetical protein VHN39_11655, partial [Phenylobacterium sp.]|nr:hypothetical protein [Phenylobacterium sp.]
MVATDPAVAAPVFVNHGAVTYISNASQADATLVAADDGVINNLKLWAGLTFLNDGSLHVQATEASATGFANEQNGPSIDNAGQLTVDGATEATGIASSAVLATITNSGQTIVTGGTGLAIGIDFAGGHLLQNAGLISVTSNATAATGIPSFDFLPDAADPALDHAIAALGVRLGDELELHNTG